MTEKEQEKPGKSQPDPSERHAENKPTPTPDGFNPEDTTPTGGDRSIEKSNG
jgi:hypothetical protein